MVDTQAKLEQIRSRMIAERDTEEDYGEDNRATPGDLQGELRQTHTNSPANYGGTENGIEGDASHEETTRGSDRGHGSEFDQAGKSNSRAGKTARSSKPKRRGLKPEESPAEKLEREEEKRRRHAESQAKYRSKQRVVNLNPTDEQTSASQDTAFRGMSRKEETRSLLDRLPFPFKNQEKKEEGKVFTEKEAKERREAIVDMLESYFEYADESLYAFVKGHLRITIWSDMDREEIGVLADWRIKKAMQSPVAANQLRDALAMHEQIAVGVLLVPRFIKTVKHIVGQGGLSVK